MAHPRAVSESSDLHVVLFPFMAKGHTIPILQFSRLLLHRRAAVTIFTTPSNRPYISQTLSDTAAAVIDLHFPGNINGVPPGIESTDKLPEISLFVNLANATKLMRPQFEEVLESLNPPVTFMVTDGFLGWTLQSAKKFRIPRLVYYGMSYFTSTMCQILGENQLLMEAESDDEPVPVPEFPWIQVTRNDFNPIFTKPEAKGPQLEFTLEQVAATAESHGLVVNSFQELEPLYEDYWNSKCGPKAWSVGPLCLAEPHNPTTLNDCEKSRWMEWLDEKLAQGKPVLYVAFGSQAEISTGQNEEIKIGLEKSGANFLWVVRGKKDDDDGGGFEERVKDRGIVVREWVDQRGILGHEAVKGFLSHSGWNSVIESICAGVPILSWPMMAEQHLNARMVVDEIKIGLRVETCNGSVRGFVKSEGLEKTVKELMEGKVGKEVREAAAVAMKEGGSSWCMLNELIDEMHAKRRQLNAT